MSTRNFEPTGKQVKKALIDLDMSYRELAAAMGCSVYYIREITADTRKATEMRRKIARHLGGIYKKYNYQVPRWAKERVA